MLFRLYYSDTFNESKEKLNIYFWLLFSYKNIVAPLSSSSLPSKLFFCGTFVLVYLDKSIPINL